MNEIKRMQKLAGILTEIVINDPLGKDKFDINKPNPRFTEDEWDILVDLYYKGDEDYEQYNVGDEVKYFVNEDYYEPLVINSLKTKLKEKPLYDFVPEFNSKGEFYVQGGNIVYSYIWNQEMQNNNY